MRIESNSFKNCVGLEGVKLPSTITKIGSSAFEECNRLKNINLPASLTDIGTSAFEGCKSLISINLPAHLDEIGSSAFASCSALKEVTFPKHHIIFGSGVFRGTAWLNTQKKETPLVIVCDTLLDGTAANGRVVVPDGVLTIGSRAFYGNNNITAIELPQNLKTICADAFTGCENLNKITVPSSVSQIDGNAFAKTKWCEDALNSTGAFVVNSTLLATRAIDDCVDVPKGVKNVDKDAVGYSNDISWFRLPDGVKELPSHFFYRVQQIMNIVLPSTFTKVVDVPIYAYDGFAFENGAKIYIPVGSPYYLNLSDKDKSSYFRKIIPIQNDVAANLANMPLLEAIDEYKEIEEIHERAAT
jgi:hypothetical protein